MERDVKSFTMKLAHFDYFLVEYITKSGGQRMATLLMYLPDVEEGGESVFPAAKGNYSAIPWWNELSESGDCAVIKGNKWSSTKWMRVHEYKA